MVSKSLDNKLTRLQKVLILISTSFGMLIGGAVWSWNVFAVPAIQSQIEKTTNPIVEKLEYQNILTMVGMPDSLIIKANKMHAAMKRLK